MPPSRGGAHAWPNGSRSSRDCWTGAPAARKLADYTLPPEILCLPTPAHEIPILLGGHSPRALARAGAIADGWLPQQTAGALAPGDACEPASADCRSRAGCRQAAREPSHGPADHRIGRAPELVADALPALAEAGVDEVIVDLSWENDDQVGQVAALSAATVGA